MTIKKAIKVSNCPHENFHKSPPGRKPKVSPIRDDEVDYSSDEEGQISTSERARTGTEEIDELPHKERPVEKKTSQRPIQQERPEKVVKTTHHLDAFTKENQFEQLNRAAAAISESKNKLNILAVSKQRYLQQIEAVEQDMEKISNEMQVHKNRGKEYMKKLNELFN